MVVPDKAFTKAKNDIVWLNLALSDYSDSFAIRLRTELPRMIINGVASKSTPTLFTCLLFPAFILLYFYSTTLLYSPSQPSTESQLKISSQSSCNLFKGHWVYDTGRKPMYNESCPFHRNAWNCLRNQRDDMDRINSWRWTPQECDLRRVDPDGFLGRVRNKNIGFVGDSLNENFLVSFLCVLRVADAGAKKWKRKGAWRGAYFPKFNVTVAYHRAVLLSKYQLVP